MNRISYDSLVAFKKPVCSPTHQSENAFVSLTVLKMDNITATNTSNNTVSSSSWNCPSKAEGIVLCSVFTLEALLIVVGNLLTIVLYALNKTLPKKSLFLVINMAVADLILGALFSPFQIYMNGGYAYSLWTPTCVDWSFLPSNYYHFLSRLITVCSHDVR